MMRLSSFFIFLLFFGQSHAQGISDSIYIGDTVLSQEVFPYDSMTHISVSDTLDRSVPVGEELYEEMFSGIKNTPWYRSDKHALPIPIPSKSDSQYLLLSRWCADDLGLDTTYSFNIVSFLSENDTASYIYWLSYYSDPPSVSTTSKVIKEEPGDWGQFGIYSYEIDSDTLLERSWSTLLNDTLLKKTVVKDYKNLGRKESTVNYLRFHYAFSDLPYGWMGEYSLRNDSLIYKQLERVPDKYLEGSGYSKE